MASEDQLKQIQESLAKLLEQNERMSTEITELKRDNAEMKRNANSSAERIQKNRDIWEELNKEGQDVLKKMQEMKKELQEDNVEEEVSQEMIELWMEVTEDDKGVHGSRRRIQQIKKEDEMLVHEKPFAGVNKEERMDVQFGINGDCSALAMRRFVERYKVVKDLNMKAKITGWDVPDYRAGKLKLCFMRILLYQYTPIELLFKFDKLQHAI